MRIFYYCIAAGALVLALGLAAGHYKLARAAAFRPLTEREQLTLRTDQVDLQQAQQAFTAKAQALPEYQASQRAQQRLNDDVQAVFASRKLKPGADAVLCDGPGEGACAGLGARELALVAAPARKPEAKK